MRQAARCSADCGCVPLVERPFHLRGLMGGGMFLWGFVVHDSASYEDSNDNNKKKPPYLLFWLSQDGLRVFFSLVSATWFVLRYTCESLQGQKYMYFFLNKITIPGSNGTWWTC